MVISLFCQYSPCAYIAFFMNHISSLYVISLHIIYYTPISHTHASLSFVYYPRICSPCYMFVPSHMLIPLQYMCFGLRAYLHIISLAGMFTCFDIHCFCMIKGLQNKCHCQLKSNSNTNEGKL